MHSAAASVRINMLFITAFHETPKYNKICFVHKCSNASLIDNADKSTNQSCYVLFGRMQQAMDTTNLVIRNSQEVKHCNMYSHVTQQSLFMLLSLAAGSSFMYTQLCHA